MEPTEKPKLVPVKPDQVDTATNHRECDLSKPVGITVGGRLYAAADELARAKAVVSDAAP